MNKVFTYGWGTITNQWNDTAGDKSPTEMLCYDKIGKDPWSDGGISADDIAAALNEVPTDRDLHVHISSKGGDVHEGMTITSRFENWKAKTGRKIVVIYDGIAASTASWAFANAADEVRAYKGSQVFVHDAMAIGMGNAEQLIKTAEKLNTTSDQIAGFYADYSGGSKKHWRELMRNETLMTAETAEEEGLVDSIIDSKAVRNFTARELVNMSNQLASVYNSVADKRGGENNNTQDNKMKEKLIAILIENGVKEWEGKPITKDTPDEHLEAALKSVTNKVKTEAEKTPAQPAGPTLAQFNEINEKLKQLNELALTQRTLRIGNEVQKLIENDQLTEKEKEKAIARCMKDETYLDELKSRPARPAGASPLKPITELVGNSFNEIQGFILENTSGFMKNFIGNKADGLIGEHGLLEIRNRGIVAANAMKKHKAMLIEMFNTNTIDAGLQRQIILQEMLEEFALILLPLQSFSTVFSNVPLEGTDEVDVPFYPLATDNGNSWDPAVGYATMGNTTTNTRPVVVGGSGTTSGANAAANTAKDRKWIGAAFSSYELARQPYINVQKLMNQKANRLAVLIFQDIISRVITAANFGASVKAVPAAQFSGDDIADLWETATGRNWPAAGRSLTLTHQYKTPLLKDATYKQYLSYGSTDPNRKAIIKEAYGFDEINTVPNLDSYGPANESLKGWIAWMYAVLVATAPIMPTPEVRALMTRYDIVVHPSLGATLEYRRFGDVVLDQTKEVVECSYGANKGVASALARITGQ